MATDPPAQVLASPSLLSRENASKKRQVFPPATVMDVGWLHKKNALEKVRRFHLFAATGEKKNVLSHVLFGLERVSFC